MLLVVVLDVEIEVRGGEGGIVCGWVHGMGLLQPMGRRPGGGVAGNFLRVGVWFHVDGLSLLLLRPPESFWKVSGEMVNGHFFF